MSDPASEADAEAAAIAGWMRQLRDPNPHTRWGAVSELGSRGHVEAIPELVAGIIRCRDDSGDWHVFWRSLWALNNMPDAKVAVPFARRALVSTAKEVVWRDRWNAAVALCYLRENDPQAIAFLRATLGEDHPQQLKNFSITSFSYANNDQLFEVIEDFIADPEVRVRRAVLDALRHWKAEDPRRIAAILRMLDDPEQQVRWRAAMHLGRHRTDEVVAALQRRLGVETDPNVREKLERSLTAFGELPAAAANPSGAVSGTVSGRGSTREAEAEPGK